jgi:hypothetical protein
MQVVTGPRNKRKRSSSIWNEFNIAENISRCNQCNKEFSINTSTSSLRKHYQKCNSNIITNTPQQPLRTRIANWIIADLQSLRVVESIKFKEMIGEEVIPSRNTIKKEILSLYELTETSWYYFIHSINIKITFTFRD